MPCDCDCGCGGIDLEFELVMAVDVAVAVMAMTEEREHNRSRELRLIRQRSSCHYGFCCCFLRKKWCSEVVDSRSKIVNLSRRRPLLQWLSLEIYCVKNIT